MKSEKAGCKGIGQSHVGETYRTNDTTGLAAISASTCLAEKDFSDLNLICVIETYVVGSGKTNWRGQKCHSALIQRTDCGRKKCRTAHLNCSDECWAVCSFRLYLENHKLTIGEDCNALEWILYQEETTSNLVRWQLFLSGLDCDDVHWACIKD